MKKELAQNHTIYKNNFFPKTYKKTQSYKKAIIGIGGNVGNVITRFNKLIQRLKRDPKLNLVKTSIIVKNPPFGFYEQEYFYNSVLLINTKLSPRLLLKHLLYLENSFSRKRSFKNAPRTLDLDIIFFESIRLYNNELTIPHPHWKERSSVLIPLTKLGAR